MSRVYTSILRNYKLGQINWLLKFSPSKRKVLFLPKANDSISDSAKAKKQVNR
jgi:hypothetical protein